MNTTNGQKTSSGLHYSLIDLAPPWLETRETVLMVAGLGTTHAIWSEWLPVLAERYRLVCADLRGFGESHALPGHRFTLDGLVSDILEVARESNTERFHLVGEALGGAACLALACRGAEAPLSTLTTINAPFRGASLDNVAAWRRLIEQGGVAAWSTRMMEQRFHGDELAADALHWFDNTQLRSDASVLLALGNVLLSTELADRLGQICVPTLVLAGDASPYVPPGAAAELAASIRDAELEIFPHARHGLPFSHPRQCALALARFIERRAGRERRARG